MPDQWWMREPGATGFALDVVAISAGRGRGPDATRAAEAGPAADPTSHPPRLERSRAAGESQVTARARGSSGRLREAPTGRRHASRSASDHRADPTHRPH
jgi:hypothetical protein